MEITQKLNAEQQKLVADNHNLIYGYAHKKKLDLDEYYGLLALGLCRAAIKFDSSKSSFQTFAYMCMASVVNAYHRTSKNAKHKQNTDIKLVFLDAENNTENGCATVSEFTVSDHSTISEMCEGNIMADILLSLLDDKEREIAQLKMEGLSNSQVGKRLGCSDVNVNYYIKKIRAKWNRYYRSAS